MRIVKYLFCGIIIFSLPWLCFGYNIELYLEKHISPDTKLNLVFCSRNYRDNKDFLEDIDRIIQRLKKTKPLDEFVDRIRFYYIGLLKKEEEKIFKENPGLPPLKVRKDFLNGILNYLKSNYKLIIMDASGSVSCAELSSLEKMSLVILGKAKYKDYQSFAKGFLHELGHSLGLHDECVDCNRSSRGGPPNCASTKEEAQNWWGDLVGKDLRVNYISGCCGNKDYIRPTIASLMNDPDKAEDFGPVNERYLRKVLSKN